MSISKTRFTFSIVFISFFIVGALFLNGNGGGVNADTKEVYKNIESFTEVLREIEKNYVEPEDPQKLIYGAIKGMVQSLDPHSSFMTKEEHRELMMETRGSFTGIGIEITIRDSILTVVSPIEGTPAYKAGVKAGDKIVRIEKKSTKNMTMMEAVKMIRGPKGTKVKLTIIRKETGKPLEFSITRDVIPLRSVRHHLLTPDIGYVRISNFQSKTSKDLSSSLKALEKDRELRGLILDLRNNPGGLLSQAIKVSDLFLDEGVIVSTKGRNTLQDIEATAHKNKKSRSYPIIILVNSGSASAAEIVAGALQDNKRALILGSTTFGKGSVQTLFPLSDGSGLRLTTAIYYTPSGKSIQARGIEPDIKVAFILPEKRLKEKKRNAIKERDLEGHIEKEIPELKKEEMAGVSPDEKSRIQKLIDNDNQLRRAIQILKSRNIFVKIERRQSQE